MGFVRVVLSFVLPALLWLAYLAPSLRLEGNAVLFGLSVVILLGIIWHRRIMALIQADEFTYSMVSTSINAMFGLLALLAIGAAFLWSGGSVERLDSVPILVWAAVLALFLLSWAVPLLSVRRQDSLPGRETRRSFERAGREP